MIKRVFWFGLGVAVAAVVVVKGREVMHRATPAGLAENVGTQAKKAGRRLDEFVADVREGMAEREAELRAQMGMTAADEAAPAAVAARAR